MRVRTPHLSCIVMTHPNSNPNQVHSGEFDHPHELIDPMIDHVNVPIALRKGVRSCTSHLIGNFVNYDSFFPTYRSFITSLDSVHISRIVHEALKHLGWQKVIHDEITTVEKNGTWVITVLAAKKNTSGL